MKDPVYKLVELTGTSTDSIEDAVEKAIKRAHKTIKNLVLVSGGRNARQH
jgi:flavin-binding protein dodecin